MKRERRGKSMCKGSEEDKVLGMWQELKGSQRGWSLVGEGEDSGS